MNDLFSRFAPFGRCAGGAAVAALGAAMVMTAPSAAQSRIQGANAATQVIVLGESPAAGCYQRALRGVVTRDALNLCGTALNDLISQADRVATHVNRGIIYSARGEYDAALADYAEARTLAPDFAPIYVNEGGVLLEVGRWAEAETAFDRALALGTAEPHTAQFGLAIALEEQGEIAEAYQAYRTAAELAPEWEAPRLELERFRVESVSDAGS